MLFYNTFLTNEPLLGPVKEFCGLGRVLVAIYYEFLTL
jgi:hypothetical protein